MKQPIIAIMATALLAGCSQNPSTDGRKVIDKSDFRPESRAYTTEVLEAFGRVSAPSVSPDGKKVLYV